MTRQLELLAPARNSDIGIAAIDCGADAVYIAGPAFGARQAAGNSIEDIRRLCTYAHRFGARIFITLNTILYDDELRQAREILHGIEEAGADAVIVQDLSIAAIAAEDGIRLPLHASTQCAIQTPDQAVFYEDLGFSRLVLERQLSLEQIRKIRQAVDCELEFFVHGALCVCYSGQCYLSENIAGRSANRGACIQACRSRYDLCSKDGKTILKDKPFLSLKDLNLIDRLKDLADAGITSFKIEGRLKNISYVKNVVRAYSMELDRIMESSAKGEYCRASFGTSSGNFTPDLAKTFNRGYTSLYIDGEKGQWNSPEAAKSMGEEIGTIEYVSRAKDLIRIRPLKNKKAPVLHNGDGFAFVSGSDVIGFRGGICQGLEIRCRKVPELRAGAHLYRNLDISFEKELESSDVVREISVALSVRTEDRGRNAEERFIISVSAETEDGRKTEVSSCAGNEPAANKDRMLAIIESQLSRRTGIYSFNVTGISSEDTAMDMTPEDAITDMSPEDDASGASREERQEASLPFMSAAFLNGIRRDIAGKLDLMPCNIRPLMARQIRIPKDSGTGDESAQNNEVRELEQKPKRGTYKDNISNASARDIYTKLGITAAEPAYELSHKPGAELMRSRYCIRHELGLCPKQKHGIRPERLYLVNNGRHLALDFDCARCEMTVKEVN